MYTNERDKSEGMLFRHIRREHAFLGGRYGKDR
jgi:hypothetical protein